MAAGYSGTPLAKKLGVKDESKVLVVDAPEGYLKLLEPLPEAVQFVSELSEVIDIAHIFTDQKAELQKALTAFRKTLKPTAMV